MSGFTFDTRAFDGSAAQLYAKAIAGAKNGVSDAMFDLLAESRNLAPLDKATLRKGSESRVEETNGLVVGEVTYSAVEDNGNGRFNYALWMHEFGGKSAYANPTTPGTQPKFLEQPLKMNTEKYREWIVDEVRKELM